MSYRTSTFAIAAAAMLTAALATLPEVHAKGGRMMGGRTSIIATTDGGSGANKPIVRDHRNPRLQLARCQGATRNPFCDNPNRRRPPDRR